MITNRTQLRGAWTSDDETDLKTHGSATPDWQQRSSPGLHRRAAGVESTTKSGRVRQVPLAPQAAAALDRVSKRDNFTGADDLVFANSIGRTLDGSALRRRFKRARDAAGLRPLRWHDLRHTFGSLLIAGGVDLVSVKDALGHSQLATTTRYLHAHPAHERAAAFGRAFESLAEEAKSPLAGVSSPR